MERAGEPKNSHDAARILAIAVGLPLGMCLLSLGLNHQITSDAARYYGPLAREFGEGNYHRAFFHMVPPLTPLLAGLLVKTGLDAFTALKLVSCIFYLAALRPLYLVARRLHTPRAAAWCCVLYAISPYLIRYGTAGSLESAKIFFLLYVFQQALAYGDDGKKHRLLYLAIGATGLSLSRGEGIFYVPLLLLVIFIADLRRPSPATVPARVAAGSARALTVAALCLLLSGPWLVYQYRTTGYPVWYSRHAWLVEWFEYKSGETDEFPRFSGIPREARRVIEDPASAGISPTSKLALTTQGLYPAFLVLALYGIYTRRRRHALTDTDLVMAAVIVFHVALFWFGPSHVSKRYIAPVTPFLLPWTVAGLAHLWSAVRRPPLRILTAAIGAVTLLIVLWHGFGSTLRHWIKSGHPTEKVVGQWIAQHVDQLDVNPGPPLQSAVRTANYHNGRQPVIATTLSPYAHWAGGDLVLIRRGFRYPFESFLESCVAHHVDVIVVDKAMRETVPAFDDTDPRLRVLSDQWSDKGVLLYGLAEFLPDAQSGMTAVLGFEIGTKIEPPLVNDDNHDIDSPVRASAAPTNDLRISP